MTSPALESFIAQAAARSRLQPDPADCVLALAPLMLDLIDQAGTFLEPQHYRSSAASYSRNLIYEAPDDSLSLYAIVWLPGQWTPVHDHGSWGVVGVVEGVLEERSYVRLSPDRGADEDIDLARGGTRAAAARRRDELRAEPRPHPRHRRAGGAAARRQPAPLRRTMSDFNIYDVDARTPPAHQRRAQRELIARMLRWSAHLEAIL